MPGPVGAGLTPVIAVKVENDPVARPQAGLDAADLVVEELIEGGRTRFAAVYQSVIPTSVGPVRSLRHVDAAIVAPFADALHYSGGAAVTMKYVKGVLPKRITLYPDGAKGSYRDADRPAPHNLFMRLDKLAAKVKTRTTPAVGLFARTDNYTWADLGALEPVAESEISRVTIKFSAAETSTWTWSKNDKLWLRAESGQPFVTPDGARIGAENIVILIVKTSNAGYNDPKGNPVPRTNLTGSGKGYILVNGARMSVTWQKKTVSSQITLLDGGGNLVNLPPGRTWVELVPKKGGKVSWKAPKSATPATS